MPSDPVKAFPFLFYLQITSGTQTRKKRNSQTCKGRKKRERRTHRHSRTVERERERRESKTDPPEAPARSHPLSPPSRSSPPKTDPPKTDLVLDPPKTKLVRRAMPKAPTSHPLQLRRPLHSQNPETQKTHSSNPLR